MNLSDELYEIEQLKEEINNIKDESKLLKSNFSRERADILSENKIELSKLLEKHKFEINEVTKFQPNDYSELEEKYLKLKEK
jgi:hypothetical protein